MIIGITGGIGAGKTTSASFFHDLGIHTINADEVCKDITDNNQEVLNKIIAHFGEDILTADKKANRDKLREIIFSNIDDRKWIENLLHPLVNKDMLKTAKESANPYCIIDSPLIIESDFHKVLDKIIVIDCEEEKQIERMMKKNNYSEHEVKQIIEAQLNKEERLKYADFVIDNNGTFEDLKNKINELHQNILQSH